MRSKRRRSAKATRSSAGHSEPQKAGTGEAIPISSTGCRRIIQARPRTARKMIDTSASF
jgi:hypothetical protein